MSLENTSYHHGEGSVQWEGTRSSHTDCSGFLDALLIRCYGYSREDFKRWFGSHRPTAARYYDAIVAQKGFVPIEHLTGTSGRATSWPSSTSTAKTTPGT